MKSTTANTVAFIVARLNSSRFPAKHLRHIGPKKLLSWTIEGLQRSNEIDAIVLTSPADDINLPLQDIAQNHNIHYFAYSGDPDAVTSRLCSAAETYNAEICLLISGDCPLIDGEILDDLIRSFRNKPKKDCLEIHSSANDLHNMLQGVSIAHKDTWLKAEELSITPELKEHHFPVLYQKRELFDPLNYIMKPEYCSHTFHRLSIDTWSDLCFFEELYLHLKENNKNFTLCNAVAYLNENRKITAINSHVHQRLVNEVIPKIVFVSQSQNVSQKNNRDEMSQWLTLVSYLIESMSWPVHVLTDDSAIMNKCKKRGIPYTHFNIHKQYLKRNKYFKDCNCAILDNKNNVLHRTSSTIQDISQSTPTVILDESSIQFNPEFDHDISSTESLDDNATIDFGPRIADFIQSVVIPTM